VLLDFYQVINKKEKQLEIIYVGCDTTEREHMQYYRQMPWVYIPYGDPRIQQLKGRYDVKGIPALIALRPTGELITKEGRSQILTNDYWAWDDWVKL
jgi:nucleoredoxin